MEAMSEDGGGSVRGAARGLASRLRAAWSSMSSDPVGGEAGESRAGYKNVGRPENGG
jgi:hypothetical protein